MLNSSLFLILIPSFPLVAALLVAILGPKVLGRYSHWPVIVACLLSFVCSLGLTAHVYRQVSAQAQTLVEQHADPANTSTAVSSDQATIGYEEVHTYWTWALVRNARDAVDDVFPSNDAPLVSRDFHIDVALRADPLTCIMLTMVTLISSLVAIFASGYMQGDRGYWRFFAYIGIFVFSMTMLVSVSNFLLLFVFWEAVGACSYLLIGFWYEKDSAAAAGKKAFLVNRIGDFGFLLALFLIWVTYGTWNYHDTATAHGVLGQMRLANSAFVGGGLGLAIGLLLLAGACGKSAQFPLLVWLPDAMEGPTPVSALIHAATMVTAGVYMITRCTPLYMASPTAQLIVASIGAGTALLAGFIALTQCDLKRVLAYSTISQLGYMFLGLGCGTLAGITAGMFHLFTHAFFKALLFLGSGSVMHAMGNVVDMRRFGGLRRIMPITHWTFAFGCLALAGVFPFAGFWSKDAILGSVHGQAVAMQSQLGHAGGQTTPIYGGSDESHTGGDSDDAADSHDDHHALVTTAHLESFTPAQLRRGAKVYLWLYYLAIFTAFLTAFYTFRAFFMTFWGDEEVPHEAAGHAHESPPSMWVPLAILAAFALGIGFMLESTHAFASFLQSTPSLATPTAGLTPQPGHFDPDIALLSSAVALVGICIAAFLYLGGQREAAALARIFDSAWLGRVYQWSYQKLYLDEIYDGLIVKPLQRVAQLFYLADRWIVDGLVNAVGWLPRAAGNAIRGLNMGFLPFYGLVMIIGMCVLIVARVWGGGQ